MQGSREALDPSIRTQLDLSPTPQAKSCTHIHARVEIKKTYIIIEECLIKKKIL